MEVKNMWLAMGAGAIIFAILNLVWLFKQKSSKWFGFISLSLTALTVCAFYSDAAMRVINEDWGGLMDILPSTSKALWICVIISILANSIMLLGDKK
jgi:Mn2+/Fe2+ NRAMP family transporter